MIDLRNKMIDCVNESQKRKICPVLPPVVVCVERVSECGKTVTDQEIRPIFCFMEHCEFFCEIHGMCMYRCEHLEIVHGLEIAEDEEEGL